MTNNTKYFIRGLGVGIIISVSIIYISSIFLKDHGDNKPVVNNNPNNVIEKTTNKTVFVDEELLSEEDKTEVKVPESTTEQIIKVNDKLLDNVNTYKEEEIPVELIKVEIEPNFGYYKLAASLKELNLIENEQDFVNYCKKNPFTLYIGTYDVPQNSTYEQIIEILKRH